MLKKKTIKQLFYRFAILKTNINLKYSAESNDYLYFYNFVFH